MSDILEITPKIIVFGSRVIQMSQVVSARYGFVFPLRFVGIVLCTLGGVALAASLMAPAIAPRAGGRMATIDIAVPAAIALAVVALGIWCTRHRKNFLTVNTSDGDKLQLESPDRELLLSVIDRIKAAMVADRDSPTETIVNITAGTIETRAIVDASSTSIVNSPGAAVVAGNVGGPLATAGAAARPPAYAPPQLQPAYRDSGPRPAQPQPQPATAGSLAVTASPAAVAIGGSADGAQISTQASADPAAEIERLIALLTAAQAPHQERLVQLLGNVQALLAAGPQRQGEARQAWASFADYALTYLSGIDGLAAMVERISRLLGR